MDPGFGCWMLWVFGFIVACDALDFERLCGLGALWLFALARVGEACWLGCFGDAGSGWLFASDLLIVGLIRFDLGFGVGDC